MSGRRSWDGATDRAYIVEQALRRIIAERKAVPAVAHAPGRHRCVAHPHTGTEQDATMALLAVLRLLQGAWAGPGHPWDRSMRDTKGRDRPVFQTGCGVGRFVPGPIFHHRRRGGPPVHGAARARSSPCPPRQPVAYTQIDDSLPIPNNLAALAYRFRLCERVTNIPHQPLT